MRVNFIFAVTNAEPDVFGVVAMRGGDKVGDFNGTFEKFEDFLTWTECFGTEPANVVMEELDDLDHIWTLLGHHGVAPERFDTVPLLALAPFWAIESPYERAHGIAEVLKGWTL